MEQQQLSSARKVELIAGVASGAAGLLGLAYALFGPTYSYQRAELSSNGTTTITTGSASLLEVQQLAPITIAVFVAFFVVFVIIAAGAYLDGRNGIRIGRKMLGIATAVLAFGVVLTGFSIGFLMLPSLLLALIATAAADRIHRRSRGGAGQE